MCATDVSFLSGRCGKGYEYRRPTAQGSSNEEMNNGERHVNIEGWATKQ